MDGVIFKDINFWMKVHEVFGTLEQGKILTKQYLNSDYEKLVEEVVNKLWKNKDATVYYQLVNSLQYLPNIPQLFKFIKEQDLISAIISASSIDVARRVQKDHGVDHLFANELIIKHNQVTGEFLWPIAHGGHHKARILLNLCESHNIDPKDTMYIGDSDNDIEAFKMVGLSIAFNSSSPQLKAVATHIIESNDLQDVVTFLKKNLKYH